MVIGGKRVFVNSDCYFSKISDFIDENPIGGLGISGPGDKSAIDD